MRSYVRHQALSIGLAALSFGVAATAEHDRRDFNSEVATQIEKQSAADKHVDHAGNVDISGAIQADSAGMAVIDNRQHLSGNNDEFTVEQFGDNEALIGGNTLRDSRGNIEVNSVAGDNNAQANSAAAAAADAEFVFGHGDAEVFAQQRSDSNSVIYFDTDNGATLNGNALRGAAGNLNVNLAAGETSAQQNNAALATGADSMAEATASTRQESTGNVARSDAGLFGFEWSDRAALEGNALRDTQGSIGVNVASGRNQLQANNLAMTAVGE